MNENKNDALNDLKALKGYIVGVVAFAAAITTYLTKALHFREDVTLLTVGGVATAMLIIGWLIQKSENRQTTALKAHIIRTEKATQMLQTNILENQRSSLRTELNLMMYLRPENHDTILRMAYRYFVELKGDWVETDEFGTWIEREQKSGRTVHVPPDLATTITALRVKEK